MSWISIGNLRRFTDKLFHSALTFDGSVTHNGADEFNGGVKVNTKPLEINGGVKVNTTKAEFNAPVAFTGTTTYKGNELATKADVSSGGSNIKVDVNLSDTSTNPVQNKTIKAALDEKLSTHGGTVTGATTFEHFLRTRLLDITQISPALRLSNSTTGDLVVSVGDKYADVLDSDNCTKYVPKLDGTGATGTWAINISGNALNDSEGNKIVDTYAKKSDIPTSSAPDLTKYMKKSADSSLDMKEHPIYFGYASISLNDGFVIDGTGDKVKILGTSLFFNNSRIDTREDNQKLYAPQVSPTFTGTVTAPNVTVSTSLTIPGGKIWIA